MNIDLIISIIFGIIGVTAVAATFGFIIATIRNSF